MDEGVKIRFFYPKEVVPGSSRSNSTNYYFSTWVMVHRTIPVEISTPGCLRSYLDDSSGAEFAVTHVPELNIQAQSLVFARKRNGLLQPASVDHISNIVKGALTRAGMAPMTTRSV